MEKMQELLQILEKNARLSLEDIAAMMDVSAAQAAAMLGIGRRTLYDKLEEYGLETRKTGK